MPPPFVIHAPVGEPLPVVFDSPHSGLAWPADFQPAAPREAILTTWDAWVDELWSRAPGHGAVLIAATFPRAYIDANRAETDLDPELLAGPWPGALASSDYTRRGMGLIRRFALPGVPMYARPLPVDDVRHRIATCYRPYRAALRETLDTLWRSHGIVWHVNCHSMKSRGNRMNTDNGVARPDFVVSDSDGATADPAFTSWASNYLAQLGYSVQVNDPYRGGDIIRSHGDPARNRHSIQIEINRSLYMDEAGVARHEGFAVIQRDLAKFAAALGERARRETTRTPVR